MKNIVTKWASTLCLLPVMAMAAPATISDWGFEPNGDVRVNVGDDVVYVSPENETQYFEALMAARLQWPVEVTNGHLSIDFMQVPQEELVLLATCGNTQSCAYQSMTQIKYGCLLDNLEKMVVESKGTYNPNTWPQPVDGPGVAAFTLPAAAGPFAGDYQIDVLYTQAASLLNATIMKKPAAASYTFMWTMVDTAMKDCPS